MNIVLNKFLLKKIHQTLFLETSKKNGSWQLFWIFFSNTTHVPIMGKVVISKYQPQYISKKFGVSSSEAAIDPLRSLVVFSHHRCVFSSLLLASSSLFSVIFFSNVLIWFVYIFPDFTQVFKAIKYSICAWNFCGVQETVWYEIGENWVWYV